MTHYSKRILIANILLLRSDQRRGNNRYSNDRTFIMWYFFNARSRCNVKPSQVKSFRHNQIYWKICSAVSTGDFIFLAFIWRTCESILVLRSLSCFAFRLPATSFLNDALYRYVTHFRPLDTRSEPRCEYVMDAATEILASF